MEVRSSTAFAEPGVFGILRPVLLLPAGIGDRLTPPQLEAILAHERCHARRRDNLAAAVHMAVEAVFWFHPLVWWLGARLMEERERACDEEVLLQGSDPEVYAQGILKVCELYLESRLPCVSGVTGANLKRRIEAIMSRRMAVRLNLARKLALAVAGAAAVAVPVVVGMLNSPAMRAQSPQGAARFEVASVKACKGGEAGTNAGKGGGSGGKIRWSPDRLDLECLTLDYLIRDAYLAYADGKPWAASSIGNSGTNEPEGTDCPFCGSGLPPVSDRLLRQPIKGSPAWAASERFTIDAKAERPASSALMRGPMMRSLLEDRFKLRIHRESREVQVYELTVAKGGPKFESSRSGSCVPFDRWDAPLHRPGDPFPPVSSMGCGLFTSSPNGTYSNGTTLANICRQLSIWSDRDVVDKTGLAGMFDLHFDAHSPPRDEPGPQTAAHGMAEFTAIAEALPKLGLKLEPAKGVAEFLVIDHVERPSGN